MEPVESRQTKKGNKRARISPRQLSPLTRQLIFDEFLVVGDMDTVAETYRVPVRTVDSILHWFTLRKPPTVERSVTPFAVRARTA